MSCNDNANINTNVGLYDLYIEQGVDFDITFRRKDSLGNYINLVGVKASLTARYHRYDGDLAFEASTENGLLVVEDQTYLRLKISKELTATLKSVDAVYDLDIEYMDGNTERMLKGNVFINDQVKHESI